MKSGVITGIVVLCLPLACCDAANSTPSSSPSGGEHACSINSGGHAHGAYNFSIGSEADGDPFDEPRLLAVDPSIGGLVYIPDRDNHRVRIYNKGGGLEHTITDGSGGNRLKRPSIFCLGRLRP